MSRRLMVELFDDKIRDKHILVVDDDELIRQTTKVILESAGGEYVGAASGEEALAYLRDHTPDIILLDYMMPHMNGARVFREMQTTTDLKHCRDIPTIMLTAKLDNYEEQQDLLKMGLNAYLFKPFGHKELINVISNILALHQFQRENESLQRENLEMKNYLASILDSITDSISVQNRDYTIQKYNQGAGRLFLQSVNGSLAKSSGGIKNLKCYEAYFGLDAPCEQCPARETLATQQPTTVEILKDEKAYEIYIYPLM